MNSIEPSVQVTLAKPKGFETVRIAGLLEDNATVAVATMKPGAEQATQELSFTLGYAAQLADQCLAGNERALTTPGLARILSATIAILFRVSVAGGSIQQQHDAGAHEHCDDRTEAPADEYSGE